jgi:cytoskeletal protein CcmA (bactofilin family)
MAETDIRPVRPLPSSGGDEPPLTVLSEADFLNGHLEMKGDGHLLGSFEGEIDCGGELLVGPDARVTASVRAVHVTISGMVTGNIQASGRLKITTTGRLQGEAEVASLVVQEGGVHYGILKVHPEGLPEASGSLLDQVPREVLLAAPPESEQVLQSASPSLTKPLSASVGRVKRMWGEFF